MGHKFADMSEYGYGIALLNDCKYGYSAHGNVLRLSLIRSPKAPDSNCDIGKIHKRNYEIIYTTNINGLYIYIFKLLRTSCIQICYIPS